MKKYLLVIFLLFLALTAYAIITKVEMPYTPIYLLNISGKLDVNEVKLNNTIDLRINSSINESKLSLYAKMNVTNNGNLSIDGYFIGDGSLLTGMEQGELILYFLNKNSLDVAGSRTLSSIPNATEVTLTGAGLPDGNTLMGSWITDAGVPNLNLLIGNLRVHVAGKKTGGTKNVQFFFITYRTDASGSNIETLSTSEYSNILTNVRTDYRIWSLEDEIMFNTTDRIKIDGYAFVSGGGSAPSVEAYIQGASKTRLVLPVGAVSVEKFIPYSNAVSNVDLNQKSINNVNSINATGNSSLAGIQFLDYNSTHSAIYVP